MIQKVFKLKCYLKAVDLLSKMSTAVVSNTFTKTLTGSGPCKPFPIF